MESMYNTIKPIQDMLLLSITPMQIVSILACIIGVGMSFVLMWFAVRKLIIIFKNAVIKGTFSFDNIRYNYLKRKNHVKPEDEWDFLEWYENKYDIT